MHCIRRTALRAALSASRQVTPKVAAAPFIASSAIRVAIAAQSPSIASRYFSQTVRAQDAEEGAEVTRGRKSGPPGDLTPHGVFVRNLLFDTTEEQVKTAFEKFGEIAGVQIARDGRGMSKGYAFVYFNTPEAVQEAVANVDGSFWHGRRVGCMPRTSTSKSSRSPGEPSDTLYIGNIPYETTDAELNRIFRDLPNLQDIRVAVDRATGWPRGFAHAQFADVESAKSAWDKLSGIKLGERQLVLDFSKGSMHRGDKKNFNRE